MNAIELLVELGAMDDDTNELTDLGVCLSALSLEPRESHSRLHFVSLRLVLAHTLCVRFHCISGVGKMVIMSHLIGCTKASSSMAVAMSYKSPFALPPPAMRKSADAIKIRLSEGSESGECHQICWCGCWHCETILTLTSSSNSIDQITSLNVLKTRDVIFKRGMGPLHGWCKQNFLNFSSLNMISDLRKNISRELESLGFPPSAEAGYHNRNGDFNPAFLQAAIVSGLYPNVAFRRNGDVNFSTMSNKKTKIHLSSVNAVKPQPLSLKCQVPENEMEFVVYGDMVKGKAMFTCENTTHLVSPLPLLLLCGQLRVRSISFAPPTTSTEEVSRKAIMSIDNWLVFLCEPEISAALAVLRQRLDSAFLRITADPSNFTDLAPEEKDAVDTLSLVLNSAFRVAPKR